MCKHLYSLKAPTHVNLAKRIFVFMFDAMAHTHMHTHDTARHSKRLFMLGTDSFAGDVCVPQT